MKTIVRTIFLSLLFLALGCSKDDDTPVVLKSEAKAMTSFIFVAADNPALSDNLTATVTEASKTISGSVPNGTNIQALMPQIQVSPKATVSPGGVQDFRSPVTYTVTAEDGSTATYRVSIMIMASDAKQIVSFIFAANGNDTLIEAVAGEISEDEKTITVEVPFGTDLTALVPTIEIPENASIDPIGAQDFSEPVRYTITAEDGTAIAYTVSVTVLETPNSAPLAFELISPTANGANAGISLTPNLIWNASVDPDGDAVTYDIYLNTVTTLDEQVATADELYAENLTDTTYAIPERFNWDENHAWRVVAKDPDGATTRGNTSTFNTRDIRFIRMSAQNEPKFEARTEHTTVVFDNKLWVIGGYSNGHENDVWSSEDGIIWKLVTDEAAFDPRYGHSSMVFDNKLWVIGGIDSQNTLRNDVWFSEDGANWTLATDTASFSERWLHSSVVFDNKMWVIGGLDADRKNDVWFSDDGVNWSLATNEASFSPRQNHTSVVFNDRIWVIGGFDDRRKNDVWSSEDGVTWSIATSEAAFTTRANHTSVVFDNKLWVIGGRDITYKNDIWSSEDGASWSEVTSTAAFSARTAHTSVVFDDKVWIINGENGAAIDDVWIFE